ncbi:MAG: GNAT family N-acetyltransferase [Granulosicoccus sp.]
MTGRSAESSTGNAENRSSKRSNEQTHLSGTFVQHLSTEAEFDTLHQDWQRLHGAQHTSGLFNSWYWNRLWWQYYGEIGELFIVTVSVNDLIVGIAPFYRCQTKALKLHDATTLRFIGSGGDTSPDDLDFLYSTEYAQLVFKNVCDYIFCHSQCTRFLLNDLVADSGLVTTILGTAPSKHWKYPAVRKNDRRVDSLPESIEAFEKNLSRNSRKQRKRRRQKLYQSGNKVEFMRCTNSAQIDAMFGELLRVHNLRHAGNQGSDSFQSDKYQRFHLAIMNTALEHNELRLLHLIVDGKTVGLEYAFLCKNKLLFFQTGFDPQFQHLSPGHLLMMETIDQAIEDKAQAMDLLKGDYEYKHSYATQIKTSVDIDLWRNPILATIKHLIRKVKTARNHSGSMSGSTSESHE